MNVLKVIFSKLKGLVLLITQDFQSVVVGTWLVQIHGKHLVVKEEANIVDVLIVV